MEKLELSKRIEEQLVRQGKTRNDLSRDLNMSYSAIWQMLDKDQMQVKRLAELSEVLHYNFFRELAQLFPFEEPDYSSLALNREKEEMREELKELKTEIRVLKEAIRLMK